MQGKKKSKRVEHAKQQWTTIGCIDQAQIEAMHRANLDALQIPMLIHQQGALGDIENIYSPIQEIKR